MNSSLSVSGSKPGNTGQMEPSEPLESWAGKVADRVLGSHVPRQEQWWQLSSVSLACYRADTRLPTLVIWPLWCSLRVLKRTDTITRTWGLREMKWFIQKVQGRTRIQTQSGQAKPGFPLDSLAMPLVYLSVLDSLLWAAGPTDPSRLPQVLWRGAGCLGKPQTC